MRKAALIALALCLLGTAPNQVMTRGAIYAMNGAGVTCTSTCPSWSGSTQAATVGDFTSNYNHSTCSGTAAQLIDYQTLTGCAVNSSSLNFTYDLSSQTASSAALCNPACGSGGGSPQTAAPYTATMNISVIDGTHPVKIALVLTSTGNTGNGCLWTLKDSAGTTQLTGSATGTITPPNVVSGATGTWTFTLTSTYTAEPVNGVYNTCSTGTSSASNYMSGYH